MVNIISFEDCSIGYDVIDEIVKWTGGVPYCIGFKDPEKITFGEKPKLAPGEKLVGHETIAFLNF